MKFGVDEILPPSTGSSGVFTQSSAAFPIKAKIVSEHLLQLLPLLVLHVRAAPLAILKGATLCAKLDLC